MKTKLAQQKVAMWLAGAAFLMLSGCGGDTTPTPTPTKQQLYLSCGDPACRGYTAKAGVPLCTTEKVGDSCTTAGTKCDPMDGCNAVYTCAASDPRMMPGGCPISRRKFKTDIQYLDDSGLRSYAAELSKVKLATYKYKTGGPTRLGFIIEDHEPSVSIDSERDMVDLYGYTSMAVAALKLQDQKIAVLEKQLAMLQAQLTSKKSKH